MSYLYSASELDDINLTVTLAKKLLIAAQTSETQLFTREISMGSCLKNEYVSTETTSGHGELLVATRVIRPMVRPYGEFPCLPLAGDNDLPDGYLLLLPKYAMYAAAESIYVKILGTLHVDDGAQEDDKHLVIPSSVQISLEEACMLVEEIRLVKTYLLSYKNVLKKDQYLTPIVYKGFSWAHES